MPNKMYISVEKLAFTREEKSHEFKICNGKDLYLVCRDHHSSADLAGDHLDIDPLQLFRHVGCGQGHIS